MKRPRTTLALLIGVCAAPVVASWLFWWNPQWLPTGRGYHGELIEPVQAVAGLPQEQGRWTLLLSAAQCDARCGEAEQLLHQVQRALAPPDRGRVQVLRRTAEGETRIWVVDPFGNAMMRYPVPPPAQGMVKDMERLLRVSQHWRSDVEH